MSSLKAPNHPVSFSSHFQPLEPSTTSSVRANQYGFVKTTSFFQCAGTAVNKRENFQVDLVANTALNNLLEPGTIYSISGKMIAMNDGSPPLLTYSQDVVTPVAATGGEQPDFANKTYITGLGMVTHRQEVVSDSSDAAVCLEVIVAHSDWDAEAHCIKKFDVKYVVPGSKNLIKTHTLYVVGREVNIFGRLVDFDMDSQMAVVQVAHVSVTNGHQIGKLSGFGPSVPSSGSQIQLTKFTPKKACGNPSQSSSKSVSQPCTPDTPTVKPRPTKKVKTHESDSPATSKGKGKQKAVEESDDEDDDEEDDDDDENESEEEIHTPTLPKPKRGRPRKDILKEAAKNMKKF